MWRLLMLSLLVLAGCGDGTDTTPPHRKWVCVQKITTTELTYIPQPDGTLMMLPYTATQCVQAEHRCVWGEDYRGEKRCAP